jgi:FtsZ-binding cell division protein ZapB
VPGAEKNKGAILNRVYTHIQDGKAREKGWDTERALLNQTIEELHRRNETLKESARRAWADSNKWQERCRQLGGDYDDWDSHGPQFDGENGDLDATVP